jgi:hypothetical protein
MRRWILSAFVVCLAIPAIWCADLPSSASSVATGSAESHKSDFNGDGYADLAVGSPWGAGSGSVNVIYGSRRGLQAAGDLLWTLDSPGIKGRGSTEPAAGFGFSVATGDLDGDGFGDLAVGSPQHQLDSGAVNVIYGSHGGLRLWGISFGH